ncbi:MAG: cell division protein FtsA [Campylobacterota bacterium]|nr:cell division protein FtsA [Campylobacterota bacterium]
MHNSILAIDIGASNITSIVATKDFNNRINILGVGIVQSKGVNKGNIIDISLAGNTINESVLTAMSSSGSDISKAVVSLSGANIKTIRATGSINITSGQITEKEIKNVLDMAVYNANIITDYEIVHVLPVFFRVDDGVSIVNPLNMNGSRLEVLVNVITTKKTALTNIRNALKTADIEVDKFVLAGYASSLSILDEDEKNVGTIVVNLGATTSQIVVYKGSSIIFSDFLPIGSEHITNDLSIMLDTPYSSANMVKNRYGTLLPITNNEDDENNVNKDSSSGDNIEKIKLQKIGTDNETKEISLEQIQPILHARVEEILLLIHDRLYDGSVFENINGGIVLTGGMTLTKGVKELASKIFPNVTVKVSNPKNIQNGYVDFDTPTLSTAAGLLIYELDFPRNFELDSNKSLKRRPVKKIVKQTVDGAKQVPNPHIAKEPFKENHIVTNNIKNIEIKDGEQSVGKNKNNGSILNKVKAKLGSWF